MSKAMAIRIGRHNKCLVKDFKEQSVFFTHKLPTQEETSRVDQLYFQWRRPCVTVSIKKTTCLAQILAGFATSRILKRGAVPTVSISDYIAVINVCAWHCSFTQLSWVFWSGSDTAAVHTIFFTQTNNGY
jgi:hypothetical protein